MNIGYTRYILTLSLLARASSSFPLGMLWTQSIASINMSGYHEHSFVAGEPGGGASRVVVPRTDAPLGVRGSAEQSGGGQRHVCRRRTAVGCNVPRFAYGMRYGYPCSED